MDLTESYLRVFDESLRRRYQFFETRNAAAILAATNPPRFDDVRAALGEFVLSTDDLTQPGKNETKLAKRLNEAFRSRGWRESRVDTVIRLSLVKRAYPPAGEREKVVVDTEVFNKGYQVDNVADRVALDVEWNAKDGNLDRDLGAYRSLYDSGLIDVAVMITRTQDDLKALAYRLSIEVGQDHAQARTRLATATSTNTGKLVPKLQRGDGGGCPILVVAICEWTWVADTPQ